ncbi:hypothetical protein BJY04DRAFT_179975 [Aspergillus karnatakaensis]|uniref:uncharacterized protein n=1 Tax=Aspergillus karnatakaensis TaxID=1810916 RepID=UPI003CCD9545
MKLASSSCQLPSATNTLCSKQVAWCFIPASLAWGICIPVHCPVFPSTHFSFSSRELRCHRGLRRMTERERSRLQLEDSTIAAHSLLPFFS